MSFSLRGIHLVPQKSSIKIVRWVQINAVVLRVASLWVIWVRHAHKDKQSASMPSSSVHVPTFWATCKHLQTPLISKPYTLNP